MTEQLSLTGGPPVITAEDGQRLGPSQRDVLDELQAHGPLSADEAGAIVHERRGKHTRDERCAYCTPDGLPVLESLAKHRLAAFTRGVGWVATESGPGDPPRLGTTTERSRPEAAAESSASAGARARRTDPPTSHAAAQSVGDLRASQIAVLLCFRTFGAMHDELLQARYEQQPPQSVSGLRTRRRELFDRGLLRATGETAKTVCNRATAIWELTDQGRAEAQRHAHQVVDPLDAIGF